MEEMNEMPHNEPTSEGLLSVRTLVIMLAGVVIGVGVGVLRYLSGQPVPDAIVEGLFATGATIVGLNHLLERSQRRRRRRRTGYAACDHTTAELSHRPHRAAGDAVQHVGQTGTDLEQRLRRRRL